MSTDTTQLTEALAEQKTRPEVGLIRDIVARNRREFEKLLGSEALAEQFITATMTDFRLNPGVYECDPYSVVGGMRQAAQLGLSFGPLGHVYLVPFKRSRDAMPWATFILGYRGMIELAYRSGQVKRIEANVVREGDDFSFRYGTNARLDFTPSGAPPPGGEWTHVYALAELKNGGKPFRVLTPHDVLERRKHSKAADSPHSIWKTHPEDAWKKSAVRAASTFWPMTSTLALALEQDEQPAVELDEAPSEGE